MRAGTLTPRLDKTRIPSRKSDQPESLKEALAEHALMFDNAIVGIGMVHERVIIRCNRRFEEIFGYGPGELNNQNVRILYPSDEEYERRGNIGYEHMRTHGSYSDERVMRRKSGETFWCNADLKPLDPDNPRRRAVVIFQDISKRKADEAALLHAREQLEHLVEERTRELRQANDALRAEISLRQKTEEELLASREKYRVLFETFPIGISITDDHGKVTEINQALGRSSSRSLQAALLGGGKIPSMELTHADGSPVSYEQLPSVRALEEQRVVADVELGVRSSSGRVRWFSVTAAPIPVKGHGVVIAHVEITERKRMDELDRQRRAELAHVSRLNVMGEMAATLAHELGQPLSGTLNYLHGCQLRLASEEYDPALFHSAVTQAILHAEQASAIVKHMRQFVRRAEPETVATDLNALIMEMVSFVDSERRQHRVAMQMSLSEDLPEVRSDPLEIKQVMLNLLKNGIEAMQKTTEPERQLEVTTKWDQRRWIEVSVADRGSGVSKKELAKIFNPFFTTKQDGLGLGLAICRSIVEAHGGRLTAASNGYGGTTFRFTLPVEK
ncbi:MAG: PAS domain S-box protein [Betaproteobacteria bacterium]|nr:PAS domain S-box protein [Betaproteobacteria bacterium]